MQERKDHAPRPLGTEIERRSLVPLGDEVHDARTVDLARTLAQRSALLARKEMELARAELNFDVRRGIFTGGIAGVAGTVLVSSLVCGLVCAIAAIGSRVLSVTWVALIGFAVFLVLGCGLLLLTAAEARSLVPARTIRQVKRTIGLLRQPRESSV